MARESVVAGSMLGILLSGGSAWAANDFTAGAVMQKLSAETRYPYIAGVVEGLAYARYHRDNEHKDGADKATTGMECVYNWFYDQPGTLDLIYAAFGKFPTYTPGAIIGNLVQQACGA